MIPPHVPPPSAPVGSPRTHDVSAAWFEPLAHALPILIWTLDTHGQPDFLNAEAREYTGLDDAADFERAVHPDDLDGARERAVACLSSNGRVDGRCRLRRARDGAWRWHSVRLIPLGDDGGTVTGAIGAAIDDHDRHTLVQANQELLASEQRARRAAEDAGRMKEEFLSALGHELRTPLNAIAGWANLLKRGLAGDEAVRAIDVIERNTQVQRELIDNLLDASRVLSGHARLELQTVFLEDALTHAVDAIAPEAGARGLTIEAVSTPPRRPLTGDAARLTQVFALLLDNAVKFTPRGGRIDVRLWHERHLVRVEVRDTGSGLSPAFLPFVFDRFRTADTAGSRPGGLGLGLALVRQLVQLHGGEVEATSDGPGRGSSFTLALPTLDMATDARDEPDQGEPRLTQDVTAPIRGLSILIIEDDEDSREMLSVLLENVGAVPVAAATVGEGLRLLGDLEIDVVLSDIGMPGRDGFDLIRTLRSFPNPRVQHAPALAVTAFARKEDRERILAAGFDAHVAKPVEPRELFAAIADTVRRRQSRTGAATSGPLA